MQTQSAQLAPTQNALEFNTRFGDICLREDRLISFPHGILGFPECTVFGLCQMPGTENSPVMLLQSINHPDVIFLVGDPEMLGLELEVEEKERAIDTFQMNAKNVQFLTILTLHSDGSDNHYLTANLRAPLVIDSANREAYQHIIQNPKYTTQHKV